MILAIDPGPTDSAYVVLDKNLKPTEFGKENNNVLRTKINWGDFEVEKVAIEMVASYGMAVGKEVFETCVWTGIFCEAVRRDLDIESIFIYRKEEKMNLCGSMKAKDGNIRQALIDRFGPVGVKKNPGWFYGVSKDVWAAVAVGVTYHDKYLKGE